MKTMYDDSIKDIAWPVHIDSMTRPDSAAFVNDDEQNKKKRRRCCGIPCCPCSLCCLLLSLLAALLLLAALIALLATLFGKGKTIVIIANTTVTSTPTTPSTLSTSTTSLYCAPSCLNQSWLDPSGFMASWPFEGSFIDTTGVYNGKSTSNPPTFVTGYIGQAALFNATAQQAIYTPFIPINNVSFTIQAWINPTGYPNRVDISIVGQCPIQIISECLHITVRSANLYFGFFFDDAEGRTTVILNRWIHSAFVYDATTKTKVIYLNGFADTPVTASEDLGVPSGNFTIGTNDQVDAPDNFFQGSIDQLSVNRRAMSACEVLERATLAAYFKFDSSSSYTDSGPNAVAASTATTSIIPGYRNQAISFVGSPSSYFQASGFTSLGISNQAFSITFWIQPQILSGTLVHLSSSSSGTGSTCFPLLGFNSNGAIVAQVLTGRGTVVTATGSVLPITSSWVPVVQTWSTTNGLKLYVNNTLVSSVAATRFLGSGTTPNYLTLGGCLSGCGACSNGAIGAAGPFTGAIDDYRIYSRELNSDDVCALYFGI